MVESRNYEFACHITTQIDEAQVPTIWEKAQEIIGKHGGVITQSQPPQRQRLSYPIRHQQQSFFGWAQFSLDNAEGLQELDEWARLHGDIFRHIILKLDTESDKRAAKQAEHLERKAAKQAREGAAQKKTTTEKKSGDSGKLEKQLEDVLGNL